MRTPASAYAFWWVLLLAGSPLLAQGHTLTGRLVDESGKAIAGAGLVTGYEHELLTTDALERPAARSGDDGSFSIVVDQGPRTCFGPIRRVLVARAGREALTLHAFHNEAYPPGSTVALGVVPLFVGVTLRGRVVDPAGAPVAGARVQAQDLMQPALALPGVSGVHVIPVTVAVTDERGAFELQCAPRSGAALVFKKQGWYSRELAPVGVETPLTVTLEPSGFVEGKLSDPKANGAVTWLTVSYEAGWPEPALAAPDGTFRIGVAHRGRLRIRNHPADAATPNVISAILDGPCRGVELVVRRTFLPTGTAVLVRAVDKATRAAVASFSAKATWTLGASSQGSLAVAAGPDGSVRLEAPVGATQAEVQAEAPGSVSRKVRAALDGKAGGPPEVTVELERAATIAGRVVEKLTGAPLAGVAYWSAPGDDQIGFGGIPHSTPRTGPGGEFRIDGLLPGKHAVLFVHPERPLPAQLRCTLEAGQALESQVVKVDAGCKLTGKVALARYSASSWVLIPDPTSYSAASAKGPHFIGVTGRRRSLVAQGGTFELGGLEPGTYELVLQQADLNRLARPLEYPLGEVTLNGDASRELGTGDGPALVRGRLEIATPMSIFDRIAVLAQKHTRDEHERFALAAKWTGGAVDPNGRFELRLAPGSWRLSVLDCTTGVVLHEGEPFKVESGQRLEQLPELALARVRVVLEPRVKGGPIVAYRLAVARPGNDDPLEHFGVDYRNGIPLSGGERELELWLPKGQFTLTVKSRAGFLRDGSSYPDTSLGSTELNVTDGSPRDVKITVDPPPSNAAIERG